MIDVHQRLQLPSGASGTYYSLLAGGIMAYVLEQLLAQAQETTETN